MQRSWGETQALHAPPSLLSTQTPGGSADIHEQVECKLKITSQNMGGEKEGKENQNPEKSVYNYVHKKSGSGGCLPETGSMWVEGGQAGACVYTAYESQFPTEQVCRAPLPSAPRHGVRSPAETSEGGALGAS